METGPSDCLPLEGAGTLMPHWEALLTWLWKLIGSTVPGYLGRVFPSSVVGERTVFSAQPAVNNSALLSLLSCIHVPAPPCHCPRLTERGGATPGLQGRTAWSRALLFTEGTRDVWICLFPGLFLSTLWLFEIFWFVSYCSLILVWVHVKENWVPGKNLCAASSLSPAVHSAAGVFLSARLMLSLLFLRNRGDP